VKHERRRTDREREGLGGWPFSSDGFLMEESEIEYPRRSIEKPEDAQEGTDFIATYEDMVSPGRINFFMSAVLWEFWYCMGSMARTGQYSLTKLEATALAEVFVHSTLYHEVFHHFCDVQTYLVEQVDRGFRRRRIEEPLAVAYSRWRVGRETQMHDYVQAFMDRRFDYSSLRWYRDWTKFAGQHALKQGLADYLPYSGKAAGVAAGIDVAGFLFSGIETILESPNSGLLLWWPR